MCCSIILLLLMEFLFQQCHFLSSPEIELPTGRIRGRVGVTGKNVTYFAFEKIPYAEAPKGPLRFKPPVPRSKWNHTLDCTRLDTICFQQNTSHSYKESEDCLYINVVTPKLPNNNKNVSLPVMFFIFGGGFIFGSSIPFINSDGLTENEVILVTFNYRLSVFGFLSTEDDVIPGNYGLLDQGLALQWTFKNIHLFGGDPKKITIFGQSSGAMSCGYLLLNPCYKDFFRAAILQSGSPLSSIAYQRKARQRAFHFASLINPLRLLSNSSKKLLHFLQKQDAGKLRDTANLLFGLTLASNPGPDLVDGKNWGPVLEINHPGAVITQSPYKQLQAGKVNPVPLLIGITSEEFISVNTIPILPELLFTYFDLRPELLTPSDMKIKGYFKRRRIGTIIKDKIYLVNRTIKSLALNKCDGIRYISDSLARPTIKFADTFSKFSKTFFYEFAYDGALGNVKGKCRGAQNVGHDEDVRYLFCSYPKCNISDYPEGDQRTHEQLCRMWTDFAKFSNPTPDRVPLLDNVTWPLVGTENGDFFYVVINQALRVRNHPRNDTYPKWVKLYDALPPGTLDTY